jgi:MarR family transcriptional regulator, negative regulator of the multidrug operon emrRAB
MRESPAVQASPDFETLYPEASRAATECAMNLVKTGEMILTRVAEVLRPFGLSPAGGLILSMLSDSPEPLGPGQIRDRLLVAGPTVTGLVDSLERQGLVRRVAHPVDRRRLLVELTDRGGEVAHAFLPVIHTAQRPWLACLTASEQLQLIELLGRVQEHLSPLPA